MSITNKLLTSADTSYQTQVLLLHSYTKDPSLLKIDRFNDYLAQLNWTNFSFYEGYHLLCLITMISNQISGIVIQPYRDMCRLITKPSVATWNTLQFNKTFSTQDTLFKIEMLAMCDSISGFWPKVSNHKLNAKFERIKEVLRLPEHKDLNVLDALFEGILLFDVISQLNTISNDISTVDMSDIKF